MNYVLIAVIAILAIGAIIGLKKGFVDMLFGAVSMIIALILAIIIGPKLGTFVQEHTGFADRIAVKVSQTLNLEELAIEIPETDVFIDNLNLPEVMKNKITSAEFAEKLNLDKMAEDASKRMAEVVATFLAKMMITALCFVIVYIVALILLYLLNKVLDVFAKLPLLKQANQLAGMALGLLQAVLIVWLFFAVITVIGGTEFGQTTFGYINGNKLLSFLYTNNIPMNFITKTVANLF